MTCTSESNTVTYYPHAVFQAHNTGITMKHGLNWGKNSTLHRTVAVLILMWEGELFYIQYVTQ